MITIYKNIKSVKDPHYTSASIALERIRTGKSKDLITKIRKVASKDDRGKLKQQLPSVCFSGKFGSRNNASLIKHSGLICLDFDNVKDPDKFKKGLSQEEIIHAAFISPSGNGVKALVKIPTNNHLASFLALKEKFKDMDDACKDVSRVCYESYDPEIYVNDHSVVFSKQIAIEKHKVETNTRISDHFKVYELIKKWLDKKGEAFYEGNRNNFLCKIVSACNRFGIPKHEAERCISYDFVNGTTNFKFNEFLSVLNGVYGRYSSDYGKSSFENKEIVETSTRKVISKDVLDFSIPAKDIVRVSDVHTDMVHEFNEGIERGQSTYFPAIDHIFRFIKTELTLLFGIGNHGKSEILNQLMLLQSIHKGTKWAIFSPESYPAKIYFNKLIQQYIGKTVMRGSGQMSLEEYKKGLMFVQEHFLFLFPEKEEHTPQYIFDRFAECIAKDKVEGVVIDPYNQLYHDFSERDDQYLSKFLSSAKRFAVKNDVYMAVVAHPNSRIEYNEQKIDIRMPYYTHQLAGGIMWGNKCDNILCYHRPFYKSDPSNLLCHLASQKIKRQDINGRPGLVELVYDRKKYTFRELESHICPMEDLWGNHDLSDFDPITIPNSITDNIPF